jgi:hypothetical protein
VEYSCYRCSKPVEEGTVFCPHCAAPLIRVAFAEPAGFAAMAAEVGVPQIPSLQASAGPQLGSRINWVHARPSIILAGIISAVLMFFPLGAYGLGMFAAGAFAAVFYHRRAPYSPLTTGSGAWLGALSGMIGFGIFTFFLTVVTLFSGTQRLRTVLLEAISQSAARTSDPQTQQAFEYFKTSDGLAVILVLGLLFLFLLFLLFSALGGALGAIWLRRRRRT